MLKDTLNSLKDRIFSSARRSGRGPEEITLLAVTKTVPLEIINEAIDLGITDIGENKVQEAQGKFGSIRPTVRKHFIGHLQSNKAKKAVELFDLIESVDSLSLAEEIERHASNLNKVQECMLEVKMSPEKTKFGLSGEEAETLLDKIQGLKHVRVVGIMTMAPYSDDPQSSRPFFRTAKVLFDKLKTKYPGFKYLSMGMSDDFEVAIEEGANMVRIGTALFGERNYDK
jgi:pyridoxal phosphate enzyme (YggS family)